MCQFFVGRRPAHGLPLNEHKIECETKKLGLDCGIRHPRYAPIYGFPPPNTPRGQRAPPAVAPRGVLLAQTPVPSPAVRPVVVHQQAIPVSILKRPSSPPQLPRLVSEPQRNRGHASLPRYPRALTEPRAPDSARRSTPPGLLRLPPHQTRPQRDRSPSIDSTASPVTRIIIIDHVNPPPNSVPPTLRLQSARASSRPSVDFVDDRQVTDRNPPKPSGDSHRTPNQASRRPNVAQGPPPSPRIPPRSPRSQPPLNLDTRSRTHSRPAINAAQQSPISPGASSTPSKRDSVLGVTDRSRKPSRHSSGDLVRPALDTAALRARADGSAIADGDEPSALGSTSKTPSYRRPTVETAPPSEVGSAASQDSRPPSIGPVLWLDEERMSRRDAASVSRSRALERMERRWDEAEAYINREGGAHGTTRKDGDEIAAERMVNEQAKRRERDSGVGSRSRADNRGR